MATNRIVLLISDEQIAALEEVLENLDNQAAGLEDDFPEESEEINNLYAVLNGLREDIKREVLAS